jgi:putative addiction module component (TIGR02574 family)
MGISEEMTLSDIKKLDVKSRLEAAGVLWDSIASDTNSLEVTEEERVFLEEQYQSFRKNPEEKRPWDEVKREMLSEFRE